MSTTTYPVARKDHMCALCNRPIPKGTKYSATKVLPSSRLAKDAGADIDKPQTWRIHLKGECPRVPLFMWGDE